MRKVLVFLCLIFSIAVAAINETSVAGFFPLENSGRIIYNFNQGWRFHLGDAANAEAVNYNDKSWQVVCAPHTVELEPSEASGCRNYQGICWYRKHFTMPGNMAGKNVTVHFEAIMGKQTIYVNGKKVKEHLGGYLPIIINLSECGIKPGDTVIIAVKADNSDDNSYPPGKKQTALDFAYHGGMYRDVWLIGKSPVAMTDALESDHAAGGGVFIHYNHISEKNADVFFNVEVGNELDKIAVSNVIVVIKNVQGKTVKTIKQEINIPAKGKITTILHTKINKPYLWSPESPYLYTAEIRISHSGIREDGGTLKFGIRNAEFRGKNGFWLNGKPYHQFIGGNRHQDFAYVGNAVPNSQQWRDAKRLRDAGMVIVRAAHYPQDPAFMDACDELGLFVIVPTPGWQYWNKNSAFAERVYENTRNIIRRDRNHPCVLMWEPILNETHYPEDFALKSLQITKEEYPYPGRPAAVADMNSAGVKEHYDVLYSWPWEVEKSAANTDKCLFTREFGEYVDDWYAHNAINRAARFWGEKAMLTAALSLADTYGQMYHGQRQFIGGCQWHPFDHQRGYHPDPYYGGIYDMFRQKKYAYWMFRSQDRHARPMVFVANEMTQFSDSDVVVFSNCDSVRLTAFNGDKVLTLPVVHDSNAQQCRPLVFRGFWNFWKARDYSYTKHDWQRVSLLAEGIKDGKVVATEKKMPSRRSTKIRLVVDSLGKGLTADGSDFIVVVAEVTDDNGNVRRLAKDAIYFEVKGEGHMIGDERILANPRAVEWGSAPILIQSTNKPGKITIIAHSYFPGVYSPAADTITIESRPADIPQCYTDVSDSREIMQNKNIIKPQQEIMSEAERERILEQVDQQQRDFGVK